MSSRDSRRQFSSPFKHREAKTLLLVVTILFASFPVSQVAVFTPLHPSSGVFPVTSALGAAQILFQDGFESKDFSAWSGTSTLSGENATVVTTLRYQGNYGALFTSDGGDFDRSCSYAELVASKELFARGYFYVSRSGVTAANDSFYYIVFHNATEGARQANLAYAGWSKKQGASTAQWCLTLRNGTSYIDVQNATAICTTGRWYCVELHWRNDASVGLAELWVDGTLVCSSTGVVDTSVFGDAQTARFGLAEVDSGSTAVYCDSVKISSSYVGQEISPPVSFQDGFESGSFGAWSGDDETDGDAARVTNIPLQRDGMFCAEYQSSGSVDFENAYCFRELRASELYARGYFYVSQSGIDADNDRFFFIVFRAGINGLAYAGWKKTGGVVKWCITMRDGTAYPDVFSSTSPSEGLSYCVELHWRKDSSAGLFELWVDGALVCSSSGRNTSTYDDVTTVQVGLAELYGCQPTTVYADSFETNDTRIGTEPFPSRPNLIDPTDGASLTLSTTIDFAWTSSVGATDYQITINGAMNRIQLVSGTSHTAALGAGSYNWSARSHSASGGWSEWAPLRAFTTGLPPPTPIPIAPPDSVIFNGTSISISWESSLGATHYQVNITGQQNRLDLVGTTFHVVTLSEGAHNWSVRAYNASGWSRWSAPRAFTIIVPHIPLPPSLVAPPNSTTSTNPSVAFSWTSSLGATLYQVEVNGVKFGNTSMTSYVATLTLGSHTWRARAHNASGWSDWSTASALTIYSEPIPWWVYLGTVAAMVPVVILLLYWRARSRKPRFVTNEDDTIMYPP